MINEELLKESKKDLLNDLVEIIKIKSTKGEQTLDNPFGVAISEVLTRIALKGSEYNLDSVNINNYLTEISIKGKSEEDIMIFAHADVVPAENNELWNHNPFDGYYDDLYVYGRGSSDDKGPLIVILHALKYIKESNYLPKHNIKLVIGGDEESGSKCLKYYFNEYGAKAPVYGFTPDADFPLIYGEKGILNLIVQGDADSRYEIIGGQALNMVIDKIEGKVDNKEILVLGKSAHGSTPTLGENAFIKFLQSENTDFSKEFISAFKSDGLGFNIKVSGEQLKDLSLNLGKINVSYGRYHAYLNIRYPESIDANTIVKKIIEHRIVDKVNILSNTDYLLYPLDSPLVKTLLKVYQDETGDLTNPLTIGGGTYARSAKNTIAFGMNFKGDEELAHQPNEKVSISSLEKALRIYIKAIMELDAL